VLTNLPAHVECVVRHIVDEPGDHAVVVMEVVEARCVPEVKPLRVEDSPWRYGG
jgi:flavin reductase (DIM6/NTAB) family NADH-FMN oxidoreductase RutF